MATLATRRLLGTLLGLLLLSGIATASATCVYACSCAGPLSMEKLARDPSSVVFIATVLPDPGTGHQPVRVERWFRGSQPASTELLDERGLGGDAAMCSVPRLPAGTRWIFATGRAEDRPTVHIGSCQPHAPLESAHGQEMLADAIATFGEGTVAVPTEDPSLPAPDLVPAAVTLVAALGAGGLLFGAVMLLARRVRRDGR